VGKDLKIFSTVAILILATNDFPQNLQEWCGESMITLSRCGARDFAILNCASVSPVAIVLCLRFLYCNTAKCYFSATCLLREAFDKLRCVRLGALWLARCNQPVV